MLFNGLETERLRFRNLEMNDAKIWAEFLGDVKATEFLSPVENPQTFAEQWIQRQLARYAEDGFGLYALREKQSNNFIGQCGLMKQLVDGETELEIGYHLLPKFWHHGYASEAAIACKEFAFRNNLSDSIISIIHPMNIASQKVAIKNGMTLDKITTWRSMNVWIFRIKNKPANL